MVGRIERGTASPSIETIARLAQKLEVPVVVLFGCPQDKAHSGERSRLVESVIASLGRLEIKELERVRRIVLAAIKT